MRTEGGKREKEKRREKDKEKGGKMGIKIVFFISPCACFLYAQWSFFKYKERNSISFKLPFLSL